MTPELTESAVAGPRLAPDAAALHGLLVELRERVAGAGDEPWRERLDVELMLGEAVVRDAFAQGPYTRRPAQLAVIGPTQTGKSTLVNHLLGNEAARVSPLAGFTQHAQGFVSGADATDGAWAEGMFPGWQRRPLEALSAAHEQYVLDPVDSDLHERLGLPGVVVWDTPDFDSLTARSYRRAVLEALALADVIVLALSKEKYSDLSVWEMLALAAPLGRPVVVCLNKMPDEGADEIVRTLRERMAAYGLPEGAPVVRVPYAAGAQRAEVLEGHAGALAHAVREAFGRARRAERPGRCCAYVRGHWADWLAPIRAEQQALAAWEGLVRRGAEQALEAYQRDFLDHPQRFDSFRRAIAELLQLLELPGVAAALARARYVLTWPARQIFAARARLSASGGRGAGNEEVVLGEIIENLLMRLARDSGRLSAPQQPARAVWAALTQELEGREPELRAAAAQAVRSFRARFEPEISAAAQRLYVELQKRPAVLNSLRAARVTADAAGIALAIKTAGLGVHDLLLAPAMVSVTSMLTEGALGSYMRAVAAELRERQRAAVRAEVFEAVVQRRLVALGEGLRGPGVIGISIERVHAAESALAKLEQRGDG